MEQNGTANSTRGRGTMNKPKIYPAKELGEILKVSPKTIYRAGQSGQIPSYKIGKSIRFEMPKERIVEDKDK